MFVYFLFIRAFNVVYYLEKKYLFLNLKAFEKKISIIKDLLLLESKLRIQ